MFPGKSEANELNLIFGVSILSILNEIVIYLYSLYETIYMVFYLQTLGTPNDKIWPGYSSLPLLQKMTFADYPMNKLKSRFDMLSEAGIDLLNK